MTKFFCLFYNKMQKENLSLTKSRTIPELIESLKLEIKKSKKNRKHIDLMLRRTVSKIKLNSKNSKDAKKIP